MSERDKEWYESILEDLKLEYKNTDSKLTKRKIDILQQIHMIEEILK